MEIPCLYTDRDVIRNDKYVFISYSHKDSQDIFGILNDAHNRGVNFWYDKAMTAGDIWSQEAKAALWDPHCVGAIVFLSVNSAMSDPVYEEIQCINSIFSENPKFGILPVYVGCDNLSSMLQKIWTTGNGMSFMPKTAEFTKLVSYDDTTKSERRLYTYLGSDKFDESLMEFSEKLDIMEVQTFNVKNAKIASIRGFYSEKGGYYLKLGKYHFNTQDDETPIIWRLVKKEDSEYTFVSNYVLDFTTQRGIADFENRIKKQFESYPFVSNVSILSLKLLQSCDELIGDFVPTDYADTSRAQILKTYWLKDTDDYAICNSLGCLIQLPINPNSINCGIRLMLTINENEIKE